MSSTCWPRPGRSRRSERSITNPVRSLALGLIRLYQRLLSPLAGGACRHRPTCSEYAHEAILRHGVARGTALAAKRLARCHPLGSSGFDPVP
jgi:putative membrane protein insertion efficiency factor